MINSGLTGLKVTPVPGYKHYFDLLYFIVIIYIVLPSIEHFYHGKGVLGCGSKPSFRENPIMIHN